MSKISVKLLHEAGYEQALVGLAKSFNSNIENMPERARKNAHRQGGHNKFMEAIMLWIDVNAPRYWWQQADTYRIASKQSESTMHTILSETLEAKNFAEPLFEGWLETLNSKITEGDLVKVKANLPESFMQSRVWCMSYKTLQNIQNQRHSHKLWEWSEFLKQICKSIAHPEFIINPKR